MLPALTGNDIWSHPLVRDAFDARLRDRLLAAADALPALVDGLLVHLARPTPGGFQVLEVWDTKASYDHFNDTVIAPLAAQAGLAPPAGTSAGDGAAADPPAPAISVTQIDISGLVIPRGPVAF